MSSELEYRFGPFRLFVKQRLLLEKENPVRIGARAFDLLVLLVRQAGTLVSKDALMTHAWGGAPVEETSLRFHITALRRILGDGQGGSRYIANVSGRGYCLVAETTLLGDSAKQETASSDSSPGVQPPNNLPARLTRVVGRSGLFLELQSRLEDAHLITLVGPGGMGKSAVAIEFAEAASPRFPAGAWYVDLSLVSDPTLIASSIATAAGIGVDPRSALGHLLTVLQDRKTLLVLDNCEHLAAHVAPIVDALLGGLRKLRIVVTSREALNIGGEVLLPVGPLGFPAAGVHITAEEAQTFPALQLFVERAIASVDSFQLLDEDAAALADICRRLDGMPFAVELVAARVDSFGIRGLVEQLGQQFPLLTQGRRGTGERHRTLKNLLDWSFNNLCDTEQALLRRAAIFDGAFDIDVLCSVACDERFARSTALSALSALVHRSLISIDSGSTEPRYRLLATTRLYALDKLSDSPENADIRRRYAEHLRFLLAPATEDWVCLPRQELMYRYAHLSDAVNASLAWAFGDDGSVDAGLRLLTVAAPLGHLLAQPTEYIEHANRALKLLPKAAERERGVEHKLWLMKGTLGLLCQGNSDSTAEAFAKATELANELSSASVLREQALLNVADAFGRGDYFESRPGFDELASDESDEMPVSEHLALTRMRAMCAHYLGLHEESERLAKYVLTHPAPVIRVGPGLSYDRRISMLITLARIQFLQGRTQEALETVDRAMDAAAGELPVATAHILAWASCPIAIWTGDIEGARASAEQLHELSLHHSLPHWRDWSNVYQQVLQNGEEDAAWPWQLGFPSHVVSPPTKLADMLSTFGPRFLLDEAVTRAQRRAAGWCAPEVWRSLGERARMLGSPPTEVETHFARALSLAQRQGSLSWQLRAAMSLHLFRLEQGVPHGARAELQGACTALPQQSASVDLVQARRLLAGEAARQLAPWRVSTGQA